MGERVSTGTGPGLDDSGGITGILADAVGMAPGLLAVMCGPQGFSAEGAGAGFRQDAAGEVLPPGPVLAALTEAAAGDVTRLSDEQLVGVLRAAQLTDFLRRLNATFIPIARGACDHTQAEAGYTPSRKLKHLVRARAATCDAPGCPAPAVHADLDHTTSYPDGPTDECNLSPKCRRHHKTKQAPDWKVEQPEPGVTRWTLPSGRTHTTTPTVYGV